MDGIFRSEINGCGTLSSETNLRSVNTRSFLRLCAFTIAGIENDHCNECVRRNETSFIHFSSPPFRRLNKTLKLFVAGYDGMVCVYEVNTNDGGECKQISQYLLFSMSPNSTGKKKKKKRFSPFDSSRSDASARPYSSGNDTASAALSSSPPTTDETNYPRFPSSPTGTSD